MGSHQVVRPAGWAQGIPGWQTLKLKHNQTEEIYNHIKTTNELKP